MIEYLATGRVSVQKTAINKASFCWAFLKFTIGSLRICIGLCNALRINNDGIMREQMYL